MKSRGLIFFVLVAGVAAYLLLSSGESPDTLGEVATAKRSWFEFWNRASPTPPQASATKPSSFASSRVLQKEPFAKSEHYGDYDDTAELLMKRETANFPRAPKPTRTALPQATAVKGREEVVRDREIISNSPEVQALAELQEETDKQQSDGKIYGLRGTRSTQEAQPDVEIPKRGPAPTAVPDLPRVSGQARGYAMLYAMQPEARATVEREIDIMLKSQVGELYVSVLVDGSFGDDFTYLSSVLRRLSSGDRTLYAEFYLTNGAVMRKFDTTPFTGLFNKIEPEQFRSSIRYDPQVRAQFVSFVQRVSTLVDFTKELNPRNVTYVSVMLEDNLDFDSYSAMRALAAQVLGTRVQFVRNPCGGCYDGNDTDPQGDILEQHGVANLSSLGAGQGFTLDGVGFNGTDTPNATELTLEQVKALLDSSVKQGLLFFGLWRGARQGVTTPAIHPSTRTYEVPTDAQVAQEIELLRFGLTELKVTENK